MAAPSLYEFSLIAGIAAGDDCDPAGQVEALDNSLAVQAALKPESMGFCKVGMAYLDKLLNSIIRY
jgi:hypothetical protein